MARLDSFLQLVVEQKASDLHFWSGKQPAVRRYGQLLSIPFRVLSRGECKRLVMEILTPDQRRTFEDDQELDLVYAVEGLGRFRVNVCEQIDGVGAVFRVIGTHIPSLDELLLPSAIRRLCSLSSGLVLVTGPTGSGKSTTLAAMVREINQTRACHILTIEDPIEFVHPAESSLVTQREVGAHTETFAAALRSALREAPDVIVVGELRDAETITLALTAAETGILVFGTLHTNSAAKSVTRMLESLPPEVREEMRAVVAMVLRGVVSQTLLPRRGQLGRVAAVEILLWTEAVAHMIREDKIHQLEAYLKNQGASTGMMNLDGSLQRLVEANMVERNLAIAAAVNPSVLEDKLGPAPASAASATAGAPVAGMHASRDRG